MGSDPLVSARSVASRGPISTLFAGACQPQANLLHLRSPPFVSALQLHSRASAAAMQAARAARTLPAAALQPPLSCGLRPTPLRTSSGAPCSSRQPRREQRRTAGGVVAAAAPAAAAAASLLPPALVFDAATALVLPFYALMIAAPGRQLTQRLLSGPALFTAAAALYGLLLAMWRPLPAIAAVVQGAAAAVGAAAGSAGGVGEALRAALPSMPAFAALFGSPEITALAWVHLVLLDLLQARWVGTLWVWAGAVWADGWGVGAWQRRGCCCASARSRACAPCRC